MLRSTFLFLFDAAIDAVARNAKQRTCQRANADDHTSRQSGHGPLSSKFQNTNGCAASGAEPSTDPGRSRGFSFLFFIFCHFVIPRDRPHEQSQYLIV
jgi:hypothetical protein